MIPSEYSTTELTETVRRRAEVYKAGGRRQVEVSFDELEQLCRAYEYLAMTHRPSHIVPSQSRGQVDERLMA